MKAICKKLYFGAQQFLESFVSFLSCLLFSSLKSALKLRRMAKERQNDTSDCFILGNGPALTEALATMTNRDNVDFFVVNMFATQEVFFTLKPDNYLFVDSGIWNKKPHSAINNENDFKIFLNTIAKLFAGLSKVDWPMNLFVPVNCPDDVLKDLPKCINIVKFNMTPVKGVRWLRHLLYRTNLGMPNPVNVTNAAIACAIMLRYKKIYLYGVNHSWMVDFKVDENNQIYTEDTHFYKNDLKRIYYKRGALEKSLRSMAEAFASHTLLEEFSQLVGCKIYNRTKGSFIDAYEFDTK